MLSQSFYSFCHNSLPNGTDKPGVVLGGKKFSKGLRPLEDDRPGMWDVC